MEITSFSSRELLKRRAGAFTAILTASAMSLLLSGCGTTSVQPTAVDTVPTMPTADTTPTPVPTSDLPPAMTPPTDPTASATMTGSYKDGTYQATGRYFSPAGPETIVVSITLKGDVIVDSTVTAQATMPRSVQYQGAFISGYKTFVIGKKIGEVSLSKVSGSSLTPNGFNDALEQIKAQAKVS